MRVSTVLCPVDFSPISRRNLRMAVEMCKRIGARLVLQHNLEIRPPGFLSVAWMWSEDHEAEAEQKAAEVPERLQELYDLIPEGVEYEAKVTRGPLEDTVLFVARGLPADLLVMGTHGKSDAEHDSLTERIVIQAPCSVLTIGESYRPERVFDAAQPRSIEQQTFLVPVDFTPRSRGVLDFALALAREMPHRIALLHVVKESGGRDAKQEEREVAATKERLQTLVPEALAGKVSVHVTVGPPVPRILEAANGIDALCIVMGAHAKGMLKRTLFGTTTLGILHGAECPVWFVPQGLAEQMPKVTAD